LDKIARGKKIFYLRLRMACPRHEQFQGLGGTRQRRYEKFSAVISYGCGGKRHDFLSMGGTFRHLTAFEASTCHGPMLDSGHQRKEAFVDLALKLNVLALCAACMFVGAVLLGAF
jgi:hypothetical protein